MAEGPSPLAWPMGSTLKAVGRSLHDITGNGQKLCKLVISSAPSKETDLSLPTKEVRIP